MEDGCINYNDFFARRDAMKLVQKRSPVGMLLDSAAPDVAIKLMPILAINLLTSTADTLVVNLPNTSCVAAV